MSEGTQGTTKLEGISDFLEEGVFTAPLDGGKVCWVVRAEMVQNH